MTPDVKVVADTFGLFRFTVEQYHQMRDLGFFVKYGREEYWIVSLPDRQIEVYTQPSGPTTAPGYAHLLVYRPGSTVSLVLDGVLIGTTDVDDVIV